MTILQSALAAQFGSIIELLCSADTPAPDQVSAFLVRINDAADRGEITVKEWRELVVMASRVRRTVQSPDGLKH